jgi:hypothetical protein
LHIGCYGRRLELKSEGKCGNADCISRGSENKCTLLKCVYGRRKITQNTMKWMAKQKESTGKTEEKLDGRYKEGHERKKPK